MHYQIDRYFNGIGDEYANKIDKRIESIMKGKYKARSISDIQFNVQKCSAHKIISGY